MEPLSPDSQMGFLNWFKITVEVTQIDEDGEISFTPTRTPLEPVNEAIVLLQPQVADAGTT